MARCSTALPPDLPPRAYQTISLCCASSSRRVGVARIATLAGCLRYAPAPSLGRSPFRAWPLVVVSFHFWYFHRGLEPHLQRAHAGHTQDGGGKFLDGVLRMQHIVIMKTAVVHSRIQPEIKEQAEGILQRLGLSPTEAIRMFYTQITLRNGLPFDVAIPNDVTIKALEESRNGRNLERFDSTEELFESWNA